MKFMKLLMKCLTVNLILIIVTVNAHADSIHDNGISERIKYIQQALDSGTGTARLWWNGWVVFYSGAAIVPLTVAFAANNKILQITGGVSAAESLIGLSGMLILPFSANIAAEELRSMPENTPGERAKKLAAAELLLKKSSEAELAGKSWVQHLLGILVNAAGAVVIWKGYENRIKEAGGTSWQQALIAFAVGTSVSELQIWTEPAKAIFDERNYTDGDHSPIDLKFSVLPSGNGLSFIAAIRF